jgi:hypothetical protein
MKQEMDFNGTPQKINLRGGTEIAPATAKTLITLGRAQIRITERRAEYGTIHRLNERARLHDYTDRGTDELEVG